MAAGHASDPQGHVPDLEKHCWPNTLMAGGMDVSPVSVLRLLIDTSTWLPYDNFEWGMPQTPVAAVVHPTALMSSILRERRSPPPQPAATPAIAPLSPFAGS